MYCISFKTAFTILCSFLTLGLIFQVMFTYVVTKPTSTSREEKKLEIADLPEVVVCLDPGLDYESLFKYHGYQGTEYWRGALNTSGRFIGWNGREEENKSSHDILKDAFRVPHFNKSKLIQYAGYSDNHIDWEESNMTLRTLFNPFGRCMSITPPPKKNENSPNPYHLRIHFNDTAFKSLNISFDTLRIFFMDKVNSRRLFPDELEMKGRPIELRPEIEHHVYKIKISRSQHVQGDPRLDCGVYTLKNSYYDCIQKEIHELFSNEIGCQPPLYTPNLADMCNRRFNFSASKELEVFKLFLYMIFHDWKSKCKRPCTENRYTSRLQQKRTYTYRELHIIFDQTVDVTHSKFSLDEQTLLTKLGGSVSLGRTLLWIIASILGGTQVKTFLDFFQLFQVWYKLKRIGALTCFRAQGGS